jgi:uncharacterized protein involved in type VI secretion and phage assembly
MNLFEVINDDRIEEERTGRITGIVVGVVTNNKDPENLGRVKLKFPWLSDDDESNWARVAAPMAGKNRGFFFLPEVEDEVLVAFDHGDINSPYVLGALWNGKDTPPVANGDGKNNIRVIQSRSGHILRLTDEAGKEKIEIIDKSGKNSVEFDTARNTITITSGQDIVLSAAKGAIKLDAQQIEIKASAGFSMSGKKMDINTDGVMTIKGQTVNIN